MKYNQRFPVAISLTKSHGWQAVYEESQYRGVAFDTVFWLRQLSEELGLMIETCLGPNSDCNQMPNLLAPEIFRMLKNKLRL